MVLTWMRATLATRLATGGKSWVDVFSRYNSGTYCKCATQSQLRAVFLMRFACSLLHSQYIVFDYNLFTPGRSPIPANALWIVEQVALSEIADKLIAVLCFSCLA